MTNHQEQIAYMLSFLSILVVRNGGELVIEHLSEMAGTIGRLEMDIDTENDKVTLRAVSTKIDSHHFKEN